MEPSEFKGRIGRYHWESEPWWSPDPTPPTGAPNVLLVVLDDVGYAQLGCFGSDIDTPTIDGLAATGLRYANFHTTALCSPTRAAVLTGRNHHRVGMGRIVDLATGFPGYDARIPASCAMLPAMLTPHGYEIVALLRTDRLLSIQSSVTLSTPRRVRVSLPGSSKGAEVGRTILDRYPDSVTVDVGRKQLESDGEGGTTACLTDIPRWIFANAVPDGITASVVLDHQSVASGSDITGAIVITNNRREPVPVWGNEPIICETRPNQPITSLDTQYVVNQDLAGVDHGKRVVMDGSGWSAWEGNGGAVAELWSFDELSTEGGWPCAYTSGFSATIQRGGTVSIPFRANTLSMQPGADLTLPAGDYLLRPQAWIFPFYLVDIPPVRVTVTAAP